MAGIHCATSSVLREIVKSQAHQTCLPPAFLLPAFAKQQMTSFSTSPAVSARKNRKDRNTRRGMSPLKRTGFNKMFRLSVKLSDLPKPVLDPAKRTQVETPDHGLWHFFDADRNGLMTPEALNQHGRAWTTDELRKKDFDDLWKLWWTCCREKNKVKTMDAERARLNYGFGNYEATNRIDEISATQKAIKIVLTERWYSFEAAREMAMDDPEINLYAEPGETVYSPVDSWEEPSATESPEGESLEIESPEAAALKAQSQEDEALEAQRLEAESLEAELLALQGDETPSSDPSKSRDSSIIETKIGPQVWFRQLQEAK